MPAARRIQPSQIKIIQVVKSRLFGSDEDAYRAFLRRTTSVDGAKAVDQAGFTRFMAEAEAAGFKSTSKRKPYGSRDYRATDAQIGCIRKLWAEYIGEPGSERGLTTWLERKWQTSSLRFLELETAPLVIAALREMVERRRRERGEASPAV